MMVFRLIYLIALNIGCSGMMILSLVELWRGNLSGWHWDLAIGIGFGVMSDLGDIRLKMVKQ